MTAGRGDARLRAPAIARRHAATEGRDSCTRGLRETLRAMAEGSL